MVRIIGEVGVLLGVAAVVVEFPGSVLVDNETPVARAHGMIAKVRGNDRRLLALRRGIFELWRELDPVQ